MQDPRVFQEIETIGEQEEGIPEERTAEKQKGGTWIPVFQAVLCALALLALVVLKAMDLEKYEQVTGWYQSEAEKEIELPHWERETAASLPESSVAPVEIEQNNEALQEI